LKLLLVFILIRAGGAGREMWWSDRSMSSEMKLPLSTVERGIQQLEEAGLIETTYSSSGKRYIRPFPRPKHRHKQDVFEGTYEEFYNGPMWSD
jgi:DNA-binding transcriptional regulator YhcF (GntR family)